jgi:DNA-binding CsgD family transcriptional regulator
LTRREIRFACVMVALQILAAGFFVADSMVDAGESAGPVVSALSWVEVGLALTLLIGIGFGVTLVRRMIIEARQRERALAMARGALGEVVAERFAEWGCTPSEYDVALFALKGMSISDIARMRGSAEGTVRAQLSQVYAKAGVTSQTIFVALFIEDLISDGSSSASQKS